ncbi:hypothetical protein [Thermaurantiacus sp.]
MNAYTRQLREHQPSRRGFRRMAEGVSIGLLAGVLVVFPSVASPSGHKRGNLKPALEQLAEAEVTLNQFASEAD